MVSPESSAQSIKILNGLHWNGWNHTRAFKDWAYSNFDLPRRVGEALPTTESAKAQDWRGGKLAETILQYVHDPTPSLEAPFLIKG